MALKWTSRIDGPQI